jgi:hypothetical protein
MGVDMLPKRSVPIRVGLLILTAVPSAADIVILKSGEMFQTPKAWRENGQVHFYRNGQLVHVADDAVERLVHDGTAHVPPGPDRSQSAGGLPPANDTGLPPRSGARPPASQGGIGFRGLQWGQPVSALADLQLVETDPAYGGVQQYVQPSRPRRFGRASVDNIYYGFWQGSLYTILIEVSNYLDYEALRAEAFRRYGKGQMPVPGMERYRWTDLQTDRMLSYDDKTKTGYLWMRSRAIHAKVSELYPD